MSERQSFPFGFRLFGVSLAAVALTVACGRIDFSAESTPSRSVTIPIPAVATDLYAELGQKLSQQALGDVELTLVKILANVSFSGKKPLQFEIRASQTGEAAVDTVNPTGLSKPIGWDSATIVFNDRINGGPSPSTLESANIRDAAVALMSQDQFWLLIRLQYPLSVLGETLPVTLTLENAHARVEGLKRLDAFSPTLNLTF